MKSEIFSHHPVRTQADSRRTRTSLWCTLCLAGTLVWSQPGLAQLADGDSAEFLRTGNVVLTQDAQQEDGSETNKDQAQEEQQDGEKSEPKSESKSEGQDQPSSGDDPKSSQEAPEEKPSEGDESQDQSNEDGEEEEDHDQATRRRRARGMQDRYLQFAKFNPQLKELLKAQVTEAAQSTVEVLVDDNEEPSAMGTIVQPNGYVMTKASLLTGRVTCRLSNGREVPAIVYGVDTETDLALLRLQATNLPAITWSLQSEKEALEGYWVLSPNTSGELLSVGVVSVGARKIPPVSGFIGITMGEHKEGVPIDFVVPGSAAERYGLKIADIITRVEEIDVEKREDIQAILRTKRPGDVVSLNLKRGEVELSMQLVLGNREEDSPEAQRAITQNTMSGEISRRRDDFPLAFQHDSVLDPNECGGPIVDLDGRVIGLNIARSGRVKSYALPMSLVAEVFERLSTGKFSPEVVFADQLKGFDRLLASVQTQVDEIMTEKSQLDKEYDQQSSVIEDTREEMNSLKARLKELESQLSKTESELDKQKTLQSQIKSQVRSKERELEKARKHQTELEKDRKQLLFGAQ